MISNWLSAALARRHIHYGWVMVGVTFLTALITAGTVGAPGVFIVPLQTEFGWTTAEISSALSIRFILFGLVVGILTASVATGQLVFLPLLASLTERMGWRIALALMCVMLGIAASVVLLVMCDRPSDLGLRPFGDEGTQPLPPPPPNTAPIMAAALGTLRDAARTRVFWILFATFFICGASTNGLVQVHLIPMCLDFGIPQVQAASLLAAMGVFDFFGTIVSGWLSDRYDNRWLLFWYYGLRGLSLFSCRSPISRSTACRCLQCSMASTGSQRCRRRCGSPRSGSDRSVPIWCS